ncbi:NAD(P)-binding protein, partial [Pleomassaria siparia CBS 279.74]
RHVLITGGSRGIGLACARLFAENAYRCTLLSRNEKALREAVASLPGQDTETQTPHKYIVGDVSDPNFWDHSQVGKELSGTSEDKDSPPRTHSRIVNRIDVLINCAGITQKRLFIRTNFADMQEIMNTNLTGLMMGTQYLLRTGYVRSYRQDGKLVSPVIINVASLLGLHRGYGAATYSASKAGVLGFTRAIAAEIGKSGIRVNAIMPGYIKTDMTEGMLSNFFTDDMWPDGIPLRRFGKPEEVADAALFLANNQYAHNCVINIDGGLSA